MIRESRLTDPDKWWGEYDHAYEHRTWENYRWLLAEFITNGTGGPLVDVGSGYGFLVECARRFGIPAVGLEASDLALAAGRNMHPCADLRRWRGGEGLPFETESIGGAVLNEFVDHIELEQNMMLFAELHRVLKPSGIIIVKSPSRFNHAVQAGDKGHVIFFSPSEFAAFVESFNFQILSQPFVPLPVLGTSRLGRFAARLVMRYHRPEKWWARIDLVAQKPDFKGTLRQEAKIPEL